MRYVTMFLLLLSGCSSVPYTVEDVRLKESMDVLRGNFTGCTLKTYVISTIHFNPHVGFVEEEEVCGTLNCNNAPHILVHEPITCLPFEDVRVDRSVRRMTEHGGRLSN